MLLKEREVCDMPEYPFTEKEIANVISKCRINDLHSMLTKWGVFDADELLAFEYKNTRFGYRSLILDTIESNGAVTEEDIGELDLLCFQASGVTARKVWHMYRFQENAESRGRNSIYNLKAFKKKLNKQLSLYFDTHPRAAVKIFDGAFWIRLYIDATLDAKTNFYPSNVVYLVHYPHTDFIGITVFKESVRNSLFQVLLNLFGYKTLSDMLLVGYKLNSLFQLALNSKAQGSFSRHQLQQIQNLPQSLRRKKRKVCEVEYDPDIVCEDEGTKKQRLEILEKKFGPNEQPTLEKLEFKLETRFKGENKLLGMEQYKNEPFKCSVKFEGTAVLEGFRNMVENGLANLPLPKHLNALHSLSKNHFVLKDSTSRKSDKGDSSNKSTNVTVGDRMQTSKQSISTPVRKGRRSVR